MTIELAKDHLDEIISHAQESYPIECCGLMAGRNGRVERVYRGRNIDPHPSIRYRMDDLQVLQALREIEDQGRDLVAIYHSHPHSVALPSATDRAQAFYPDARHVIVSLQDREAPVVRVFRIVDGRVSEERVVIR
ncbi:MAG: M67 family metallopeptidase [Armatimonadetes bacterium]|nr:M67 family metallopeptidase [Armatimonadota bacterium]